MKAKGMTTNTATSASTFVWELAKFITERVANDLNDGKIVYNRYAFVKPKISHWSFREGLTGYSLSEVYFEKEIWPKKEFFESIVKPSAQYEKCKSHLCERYAAKPEEVERWLAAFVYSFAELALNRPDERLIVDQVTTFVNDLEKNPVYWMITLWIEGLWVDAGKIQLENGLIIRNLEPSDLEVEQYANVYHVTRPRWPSDIGSAVLEFQFRTSNSHETFVEVEYYLNALRLFRVGSIFGVKFGVKPKSFLQSEPQLHRSPGHFCVYKYCIKSEDAKPLSELFSKARTFLPHDSAGNPSALELDAFGIALRRYKEALFYGGSVEHRTTNAITALEALYLKSQERAELSHRLAQRVAAVVRHVGFHPIEAYKNVAQAYDIRSTFIHGSALDKENQKSASDLCKTIVEYVRISLLVFLQMKSIGDKDSFINRLDNSLLDVNVPSKLASQLATVFVPK